MDAHERCAHEDGDGGSGECCVFACRDGHLIIAAGNNGQFAALSRALGHPEWMDDERFSTNVMRVRNRPAMNWPSPVFWR